jgi:hypothetical protein
MATQQSFINIVNLFQNADAGPLACNGFFLSEIKYFNGYSRYYALGELTNGPF